MKRSILLLLMMGLACVMLQKEAIGQQLKLGNNPYTVQKSAILDMESNNQGLLLVRIADTSLINALTPPDGMIIYFSPGKQLMVRANSGWRSLLTGVDTSSINNFYLKVRSVLSAGTGISYNSTTGVITNAAPDQTVSLTAGTGISISGAYPSFTVTNSAPATPTFNTAPGRVLSTTGSNNTFTISTTKNARVYYTVNFTVSLFLSNSNGAVTLDYSTNGGSSWTTISSVSQVFSGSISIACSQDAVLSGEIPANALVRINRTNILNVTIALPTTKQQEVTY